MTLPLVVEPEAAAELEEAEQWYERRSPELGLEFARLMRATLAQIARAPLPFPDVDRGTRRAVMLRFPYAAYFVVEPTGCRCSPFFIIAAIRLAGSRAGEA